MAKLKFYLPEEIVKRIITMRAPNEDYLDDSLCWRPSNDGLFTVNSAYNFIGKYSSGSHSLLWNKIWRWPTYEKIKFFLWKMAWNRLPIGLHYNQDQNNSCPFGCISSGSIMHVVRDCPEAKKVWLKLVKPDLIRNFFSLSLQDWILWNAKIEAGSAASRRLSWQKVFAQACWLIWKNRCSKLFSPDHTTEFDIAFRCSQILMEDSKLEELKGNLGCLHPNIISYWKPPDKNWIRLDTDGSVNRLGEATCGGIIRDDRGNWKCGFGKKLGYVTTTAAELLGILEGLTLCWNYGFRKIQMFSDSKEAINSISTIHSRQHPLFYIVEDIRSIIMRDWEVTIGHVFREANHCADWLAHYAHNMDYVFQLLPEPPDDCMPILHQDMLGFHMDSSSP